MATVSEPAENSSQPSPAEETDAQAPGGTSLGKPSIDKPSIGTICEDWWYRLHPVSLSNGNKSGDSGAFARLRRGNLFDIMIEPRTIELFEALKTVSNLSHTELLERTALIAGVLSHISTREYTKVAAAAGSPKGKEKDSPKIVHESRMKKLFAMTGSEECLSGFRKLAALLGKTANVNDLGASLFDWTDEELGKQRRIRWAYDYHR